MLIYRAFSILGRTLNSRSNVWRRSRPLETLQTPPTEIPVEIEVVQQEDQRVSPVHRSNIQRAGFLCVRKLSLMTCSLFPLLVIVRLSPDKLSSGSAMFLVLLGINMARRGFT